MESTLREYNSPRKFAQWCCLHGAISEFRYIEFAVKLIITMLVTDAQNVNNRRFTEFLTVTSTCLYRS